MFNQIQGYPITGQGQMCSLLSTSVSGYNSFVIGWIGTAIDMRVDNDDVYMLKQDQPHQVMGQGQISLPVINKILF